MPEELEQPSGIMGHRIEDVDEARAMAVAGNDKESSAARIQLSTDLRILGLKKYQELQQQQPKYDAKPKAWIEFKEKERALRLEIGLKVLRLRNPNISEEELKTKDPLEAAESYVPSDPGYGDLRQQNEIDLQQEHARDNRNQAHTKELIGQAIHRHPEVKIPDNKPVDADMILEAMGHIDRSKYAIRHADRMMANYDAKDPPKGEGGWNRSWVDSRGELIRDLLALIGSLWDYGKYETEVNELFVKWENIMYGKDTSNIDIYSRGMEWRQAVFEIKYVAEEKIKEIETSLGPIIAEFKELAKSS